MEEKYDVMFVVGVAITRVVKYDTRQRFAVQASGDLAENSHMKVHRLGKVRSDATSTPYTGGRV